MRLSTKGRYAVVAMIDVALRAHAGPVALATISARQQVSLSYLEQLFGRLRRCQLVESTRGPGGGYALGRNPERITVADIIRAVEDPDPRTDRNHDHRSSSGSTGAAAGRVSVDELWARINTATIEHLGNITWHQLLVEQRVKCGYTEQQRVKRVVHLRPPKQPVKTMAPNSVFALGKASPE